MRRSATDFGYNRGMQNSLIRLGSLLWLAACSTPATPKAPGSGETVAPGANHTGAPDSGDGTDTGSEPPPVRLTGQVAWPDNGTPDPVLGLAATHTTWLADTVSFGATLVGVEVAPDGRFTLELPARPPAGQLGHPAPSDHPELVGSVYMLTAFLPTTTGALHFAEGRTIRGMAFHRLLVWLDPQTLGDSGWPGGWSLVDTGLQGAHNPPACLTGTTQPLMWRWQDGYPVFHEVDEALVMPMRGAEAPLHLSGTVSGSLSGTDRLAAIPQQVALGESTTLEPPLDVDLTGGSFSATLSEAPPLSHNTGGDTSWQVTLAYLLQYADDGDGHWSLSEDGEATTAYSACAGGRATYLRYTRDVTTWRGIRLLECQNGRAGWRLLTLDDTGGTYMALDDAASLELVVSADCRF